MGVEHQTLVLLASGGLRRGSLLLGGAILLGLAERRRASGVDKLDVAVDGHAARVAIREAGEQPGGREPWQGARTTLDLGKLGNELGFHLRTASVIGLPARSEDLGTLILFRRWSQMWLVYVTLRQRFNTNLETSTWPARHVRPLGTGTPCVSTPTFASLSSHRPLRPRRSTLPLSPPPCSYNLASHFPF